ncbi:hypothetical protein P5V34_04710 [Mycobacteroides abscessus subsp. abscessus]|jgi:hypothetical protein|nr:hypothetical protein [Mycobacteroides abscessus]MDO3013288.1 hypothetical protein [Mycobacteroides abscessus subsp. abscessus]
MTAFAVLALPVYTDRQANIGTAILLGISLVIVVALIIQWWRG